MDAERFVVQEPTDVVGQRRHRRVALIWCFLERLADNVVEVAAIQPAEAGGS
jgi:hypothetical protein